ncbi:MAG: TraB/GumN family protein, partial [Burkholderiales bacterium]
MQARRYFLLALLLNLAAHAFAEESFEKGVLWKVEKDGAAASYLFGTIHVSDPRVTKLPKQVKQALAQSKSFTMEMVANEAAQLYFVKAMSLKAGEDLRALLGDELYSKSIALMQEHGFPPQVTGVLKPWGILLTLIVPKPTGEPILDQRLQQIAAAQKKPVHQLESIEEQVAVFDGMPVKTQIAMLQSAVDHYIELPQVIEQTVDAYLKQDLNGLWELNALYAEDSAAEHYDYFVERVLFSRNVRMAERAEQRLKEGGAFIAVGALHLFGEKGVPALLEKQGYRVTRV